MLAHKAEEEGIAVAEIIAGQAGHVNTIQFLVLFIPLQSSSYRKNRRRIKKRKY